MSKVFFLFLPALLSLFLFGCANSGVEGKPVPELDFRYIEAVPVNVVGVEALNHYGQAKHSADVGFQYVMSPDETLQRYLQARYKPQGMRGRLVFEIQEASVFRFDKDAESKVAGWFGMGAFEEYNLTLKVHVRVLDIPGYREKSKVITAQRRLKLSEHASVAEREQHQFEALEKALHDIDGAVQRTLRAEFGI